MTEREQEWEQKDSQQPTVGAAANDAVVKVEESSDEDTDDK